MRKSVLGSLSLVLGAWLLVPGFIPFARGTRHYGLGTAASAALTIDKPFWGFANAPDAPALAPEYVFGSGVETCTRITKDTDLSFWGTYTAVGERCGHLDSGDSNWDDGGMFPNSLLREDWGAADSFKYGLSVQSGRVSFEPVTSRIFTPRWRADARSDVLVNVYLCDGWSWAKNVFWTRFAGWALPGEDQMPEFEWTSNPHETIAACSNRWACFSCFPPDGVLRFNEPSVPGQILDALDYNAFENAALRVNPYNDEGMYGLCGWPVPTNTLISALAAYTLASNAFYHVEVSFDPVTVTNSVPTVTNTFNTVTNCVEVYTETIEPYTVDYLEPYTVHYTENREFTVSVDCEVYTVTQPITAASNAWRTVTLEVPGCEYVSTNCWLGLTTTNIVTEGTEWTYTRPVANFRTVYHDVTGKFTDAVNVGGFSKTFETNLPWRVEAAPARGVAIKTSYPCRYQWKFRNLHSPAEVHPSGPIN